MLVGTGDGMRVMIVVLRVTLTLVEVRDVWR